MVLFLGVEGCAGESVVDGPILSAAARAGGRNPITLAHATPLHQAALAGHLEVVELLVERAALLDGADRIYGSTPVGWGAAKRGEVEAKLASRGAH